MAAWAQENQTEFYRLYARLIPTELDAKIGGDIICIRRDPTIRPEGYTRKGKPLHSSS